MATVRSALALASGTLNPGAPSGGTLTVATGFEGRLSRVGLGHLRLETIARRPDAEDSRRAVQLLPKFGNRLVNRAASIEVALFPDMLRQFLAAEGASRVLAEIA